MLFLKYSIVYIHDVPLPAVLPLDNIHLGAILHRLSSHYLQPQLLRDFTTLHALIIAVLGAPTAHLTATTPALE